MLGANRDSRRRRRRSILSRRVGKASCSVNGNPFFIRGAGGGGPKSLLAQCGGNSFRTWGIGPGTQKELDEAQRLGLKVTLGVWPGHKEQGFRYDDPASVEKQREDVRRAVLRYRKHPALLMWGLGNEMENNDNSTPELWKSIEDLAKMVHEIDRKSSDDDRDRRDRRRQGAEDPSILPGH